jgi:protein-tyrosine phosphatase
MNNQKNQSPPISKSPLKICFVCLGNICRSPAAEGVARSMLSHYPQIASVDSCGTGGWHVGNPPDKRMQKTALSMGVDISSLRGRQLSLQDFYEFDYLVAMDSQNYADIQSMAPANAKAKVVKLLDYTTTKGDVPDPYYGGEDGFHRTFSLITQGVRCFFDAIG